MDSSRSAERARSILLLIFLFSVGVVLVTTVYGIIMSIIQGTEVVGQTFVDVEFPPIHIFPFFYMKPVSWLFAAIIALVHSTLELGKNRISRLSPFKKALVKLAAFIVGTLASYEVFFNFTLWSGLIGANAILGHLDPDLIINPFPNPKISWNIVFATKMYLALMIACFYTFIFISRSESQT